MGEHAALGERLVAAAKPRFKDFRVDFEKISTAASRAAREGLGGLLPQQASAMFHDLDWDLRLPLQQRYAEAGAWDGLVKYHSVRFKNYLGRDTPWPDKPALATLDLFAEHGRADLGVALVRSYIEMQHKRLKKDYSKRNPRGPRKDHGEGVSQAIATIEKVIAGAIPDRKRDLLRDLDLAAPYLDAHAAADDLSWFEQVRREVWMEKRA